MKIAPFSKTYEGRTVLDFPGFSLQSGSIYAVIGANGSGKSTFAKILSGIVPSDQKVPPLTQQSIGYLPQKSYAFRMSTLANIQINGKDLRRAKDLMDALQLTPLSRKRGDRLSGGETARMALARLMMRRYDLVILDEPTAAMDMESTILAERLILEYVRQQGCTLIIVTHSLQQARRIADFAMYFHQGRLLEFGQKDVILYHPSQKETQSFLDFYGV